MTWTTLNAKELRVIIEIEKQTDRAAAIIAGAFVERRLTNTIKNRIRRRSESEQKALADLFRESGPLGSFHARIDLGFVMGVYPEEVWKDLHTIKLIRNEFAHRTAPLEFNTPEIRRLCRRLDLPNFRKPRLISLDPETLEPAVPLNPSNPRDRFIQTIQLVLVEVIKRPRTPRKAKWVGTAPLA